MTGRLPVDEARIRRRIERLAAMTDPERPYTRRAFTDLYRQARAWLADEFRSAGLAPELDAGGNLVGRRPGRREGARALASGSHIDTVAGGGRYDGIAGVVVALEAAQVLHEHGVELDHPLFVYDFLSEEPSDYGASCVGSSALVGTLTPAMLAAEGPEGESLAAAMARVGADPGALGAPLPDAGRLAAFLELHIEQGPVLEREGVPVGVVDGIVAIHRMVLTLRGRAGHAGTTPMPLRRDALVGASAVVQDVWERARAQGEDGGFVATVGRLEVVPNGANVVPGEVRMVLEARSLDEAEVAAFLDATIERARATAAELGLELEAEVVSTAPAVRSDPRLLAALEASCEGRGLGYRRMSSGAGHDAMQIAQAAPVAMLFVPCAEGLSHHPEERAEIADIAAGAAVLLDALQRLDREL
ncbi:MAG: Zn-dependent hydrolase [Deinococcales bacterium]|jgi:N-carbamoyl-L-amino-acid hydrolase